MGLLGGAVSGGLLAFFNRAYGGRKVVHGVVPVVHGFYGRCEIHEIGVFFPVAERGRRNRSSAGKAGHAAMQRTTIGQTFVQKIVSPSGRKNLSE